MGALSYLTLDQLRSILAHEYGHFSHKDTFFSRFIYRVSHSYAALIGELGGEGNHLQYFNPLFWLLRGYVWLYEWVAASFSRNREYHADRFAVEAYNAPLFAQALVTSHIEGTFFHEVGLQQVFHLAKEGKGFKNLYHFVGISRQMFAKDNPESLPKILTELLAEDTKAFDSHPSLRDRLKMQGVPLQSVQTFTTPRLLSDPELDEMVDEEVYLGTPSAAEELFGAEAPKIQAELSDLVTSKFIYIHKLIEAQQTES